MTVSHSRRDFAAQNDRDGLFQALIETAVDGIIVIDESGIVLVYNRACERLFQYTSDEVIGENVKMLMPEPDRDEHDGFIARYRATGERRVIGIGREVFGRRKDGSLLPVHLSVGEGRYQDSRIFVAIMRDLTRARDEEAARRLMSEALDSTPVLIRDLDGKIRLWSRGMETLYGYTVPEAVGRRSHDLFGTIYPEPLPRIEAKLLEQGRWSGELHQHRSDGKQLAVVSEWVLHRTPGGYAVVTEVNHDVTAERAIESARNYLASIVDSSADAIIAKQLDGVVTAWNAAAEQMFGYSATEMIGQSILKLFPPDLYAEEDAIAARIRSGLRIEPFETRRLRKDGTEIYVSLAISPIRNAAGEIIGASKIVRDITERKQAEERLSNLQAELIHLSRWNTMGSMASSIAHELNQPLAAMINYLAALRRVATNQPDNGELLKELSQKATQQGQRATTIIQHLRELVTKGKSDKKPENLAAALGEALDLIAPVMRHFAVHVRLTPDPDLPPVEMDRVQIQQVIINLARNAAEAMAGSPVRTLQITAVPAGDMVRVDVADTGPGLPPTVFEHLFEAFVTTKSGGMGLGLSICAQIISAHGGRLWAVPNQPHGTVFAFTLPLSRTAAQ